jgi:biotin-[acetyl-CoA-carboxylase] ligase BirA-like protein
MIVLADSPLSARELAPIDLGDAAAAAVTIDALSPHEAELWRIAGCGARVVRYEREAPSALAYFSHAVVVDAASGSQFDALRSPAWNPRGGTPAVACVAGTGSGFHGHRGRAWATAPGNLHLSLACDPELDVAPCGLALTALPAVAVVETLATLGPWRGAPAIKWVNDVWIAGRKVGGVLTATHALRGRQTRLVLGIGLNVARAPAVVADRFVPMVGALPELALGRPPSLRACFAGVLTRVAAWLARLRAEGPAALLDAYRATSLVIGQDVEIWAEEPLAHGRAAQTAEPLYRGKVVGIDDDLALRLADQPEPVRRGRLALPRAGSRRRS